MNFTKITALIIAVLMVALCASACKKGADATVSDGTSSEQDVIVNIIDDSSDTESLTSSELEEEKKAWGEVELEIEIEDSSSSQKNQSSSKKDTANSSSKAQNSSSSKEQSSSSSKEASSSSSKEQSSSSKEQSSSKPNTTVLPPDWFPDV